MSLVYAVVTIGQGGNFHLKVGGAKSSGNAGDPMQEVAVSGGYNHPNHKVGGGQKLCFSKKTFFRISFHFPHFQSISSPNPRQMHIISSFACLKFHLQSTYIYKDHNSTDF